MRHTTSRGRISYRGPDGAERGREWFHVTVAPDGSRTMRAVSEIDDSGVLRDVVLTLGPDWRPRDSYVRVSVHDRPIGSAWFEFEEQQARAEVQSTELGRISQVLSTAGRTPMFGAHQVAGDGWQAALLGPDQADGDRAEVAGILLSSPLPNGASGPMLATTSMVAERIGPETVTVAAGTFDTVRYRFSPVGLAPEDVWVLPDDWTLVRSRWAHYQTTYELAELDRNGGS